VAKDSFCVHGSNIHGCCLCLFDLCRNSSSQQLPLNPPPTPCLFAHRRRLCPSPYHTHAQLHHPYSPPIHHTRVGSCFLLWRRARHLFDLFLLTFVNTRPHSSRPILHAHVPPTHPLLSTPSLPHTHHTHVRVAHQPQCVYSGRTRTLRWGQRVGQPRTKATCRWAPEGKEVAISKWVPAATKAATSRWGRAGGKAVATWKWGRVEVRVVATWRWAPLAAAEWTTRTLLSNQT
jgi:hypothetical protein